MSNTFYDSIEFDYGIVCKRTFKSYSNNCTSMSKLIRSKVFLIKCRKNRVFPDFIMNRTKNIMNNEIDHRFNVKIENMVIRTNLKILNIEIASTIVRIKRCERSARYFRLKMYKLAPQHLVNEFISRCKRSNNSFKNDLITNVMCKYDRLYKEQTPVIKYNQDWLVNWTQHEVPEDVKMILALGHKFTVYQKNNEIPLHNILADVDNIMDSIENKDEVNTIKGKIATVISNHNHKTQSFINSKQLMLLNAYNNTKLFLKQNPQFIVTEADKGNITILMNISDYEDKLTEHYSNNLKFRVLAVDPTKNLQKMNNDIARQLFNDKIIPIRTKNQLLTFTAQAPRPRCTPKVHKPGIRVITNATNSPSYNMSKFLNTIFMNAGITNKYNVLNSFHLIEKLNEIVIPNDEVMVSFDIISMFEKIPLSLVYKAVEKRWEQISKVTPIDWITMKKMIRFCLESTNYVCWKKKFYRQRDGLTIGGCVSAILADFVITDLLDYAVLESGFDPTFLMKYVDDTLMFIPQEELENFLSIINKYNKSIQFTVEIEADKVIPYLDVLIRRQPNGRILTSIYQKPTSKNRLLNYESSHPQSQISGVAYGVISRHLILSSPQYIDDAKTRIHEVLQMNGYPSKFIDHLIHKFESKPEITVEKTRTKFRGLTYTPHLSENIRNLLIRYDDKLEIGYKPYSSVRKIIPSPYPTLPLMDNYGVVYSFNCKDCDGQYIGQTGQKLGDRIKQHTRDSKSKIDMKKQTAAAQHARIFKHTFDYSSTKILATEKNRSRRATLESIHIHMNRKNSINLKSDLDSLNPVYSQLLSKHTENT